MFLSYRYCSKVFKIIFVSLLFLVAFLMALRSRPPIRSSKRTTQEIQEVLLSKSIIDMYNTSEHRIENSRVVSFNQDLSPYSFNEINAKNLIGGFWPNGLGYIDLKWKNTRQVERFVDRPEDVQLIMGHVNNSYLPLKEKLISWGEEVWYYENQEGNAFLGDRKYMDTNKPAYNDIKFIFSDIEANYVYWFPWFHQWRSLLQPLIDAAIGPNMEAYIGRMQLARMAQGGEIGKHLDSGVWPTKLHRIHVPIQVSEGTVFEMWSKDSVMEVPIREGSIFEINNMVPHQVHNYSKKDRIHLILDVAEKPFTDIRYLSPNQICAYRTDIVC